MRKLLVGSVASLMIMGGALPAHADHAWETYHWGRTGNPFTVKVVDSVTGVWDGLLGPVAGDWSASNVVDVSIESGATGTLTRLLCSPPSGKVRACNLNYGPTLWFGLATITLSGGHITSGSVQVNDFYFTGSFGNNTARRHVLCQEVGHTLGLDHTRETSCMDDTNSTLNDPAYVGPNAHDFEQLSAIYAHADSTNTTSQASAGPGLIDRIINRDGNRTVVTIIFWV